MSSKSVVDGVSGGVINCAEATSCGVEREQAEFVEGNLKIGDFCVGGYQRLLFLRGFDNSGTIPMVLSCL